MGMKCPKCRGDHVEKVVIKKITFDAFYMKRYEEDIEIYGHCWHCDHKADYNDFLVVDWCTKCGFKYPCKCESYQVVAAEDD